MKNEVIYVTKKTNTTNQVKDYLKDCLTKVYTEPWKDLIYLEFTLYDDETYYDLEDYLKNHKFNYHFYSEGDNWMLKIVQKYNPSRYEKYVSTSRKNNSQLVIIDDYDIF